MSAAKFAGKDLVIILMGKMEHASKHCCWNLIAELYILRIQINFNLN